MQILSDRIDQLLNTKDRVIVAIDGKATAGKSTLAAFLKETYSCNVISMDHFFLRPKQRTAKRLSRPGGNIDHKRFIDQVITPLEAGESFVYYPYDCKADRLAEPIAVNANPLTVIEGVYSMHPKFSLVHDIYDLTVFLQIDEEEQKSRLLLRNLHLYDRFIHEWVPMENKYFEHFKIAEKCDFVFEYNK